MVSTALVMPEDPKELALTVNGNKCKIKHSDFKVAMSSSGLEEKIIDNLFTKFIKVADKWFEFIDLSFVPDEMKEQYKAIIKSKIELLIK